MKNRIFLHALVLTLIICSITILNPLQVNAEWKTYNNGWWYTEGNSYIKGWKLIDNKWYYFNDNGRMLSNTITPDGYFVDIDGVWDGKTKETFPNKKTLDVKQQVYNIGTTSIDTCIYNNTNKILSYDNYFTIEKLENNQWIKLPFGENAYFTDLGFSLAIGADSEEKCDLTLLKNFDSLTPGKYRIIKKINHENMYVEFELM